MVDRRYCSLPSDGTPGDTEIVVSATPSENTVRFYMGRGYQPMAQPLPELLELEPGSPVLHISRRAFCRENVVEVTRSVYRADRYTLWVPVLRPEHLR